MPAPISKWSTCAHWRQATSRPSDAAEEVLRRIASLPTRRRKAVWAWVPETPLLAQAFSRAALSDSPLAGVPYAVKDLYPLLGTRTRAGAPLPDRLAPVSTRSSNLVNALAAAGAVCVGKTQLHEFAYGLTGENPTHGHCTLPGDPTRTCGGSSSGSAFAVASGIVPFALGTDTGGSIRVPAAFCGLYGVRLTPGHPFIEDAFPLSRSFDTPGWFARSLADLAVITGTLLGRPKLRRRLVGGSLSFQDLQAAADAGVLRAYTRASRAFAPAAASKTAASYVKATQGAVEAYGVLNSREAFEFHERWLGLRPGFYSRVVRERIERGRATPDDALARANATRKRVGSWFAGYFESHDFLVLPATPFPALRVTQVGVGNRLRMLELTAPASLAGLPVLSVPVRLPNGLHTGLQVVARDAQVLLSLVCSQPA